MEELKKVSVRTWLLVHGKLKKERLFTGCVDTVSLFLLPVK